MSDRAWIFGGGHADPDYIRDCIKNCPDFKGDLIIAADKGLEAVIKAGLRPDIILGDFDSVNKECLGAFENGKDISIIRFPAKKDSTDMELAVRKAAELGMTKAVIFGATGSRLDHVIGNIFCLETANNLGMSAVIADEHNRARLLGQGVHEADSLKTFGRYISFLPYSPEAVISLEGFLYPLSEHKITKGSTLGVSNEHTSSHERVTVHSGLVLCIQSCD